MDNEGGSSQRTRRRTGSDGAGVLSPTSESAVNADTGYDDGGLDDDDFDVNLPPGGASGEKPFMDKLLDELRAATAPPLHVDAAQRALDGPRTYSMTPADMASLTADNNRALRAHHGREMPEVFAMAGATPLVAGSVIDPRGADAAHFPVEMGPGSHLYGGGSGAAHQHHAGGGDAAAPSGGQRWRVKDGWRTRFVTAAGALVTLLCCTGWYMLAAMNQLNYGAVVAATSGAVIAGALIITDLFSLVAGAREGGIKLSSPADLAVVAGRLAELLRLGVRLLRVSTSVGTEATLRALTASQAGAPPGVAAHYDVRVLYHGGAVRVHVLLGVLLPDGRSRGTVILLATAHRCMSRMWWTALQLARADLAFHSLLGREYTPEQVAAVFAATRTSGLTPEEQLGYFAQLRAELTDAERAAVDAHMATTGCDLLTALHEKVYAGKGARRFAELVVLEGEGALSDAEAKELSWRRMSRSDGKAAVKLAKAAVKLEQQRDKLPRTTAAHQAAVDQQQARIDEMWDRQTKAATAFKDKRAKDSAAGGAFIRVGGQRGGRRHGRERAAGWRLLAPAPAATRHRRLAALAAAHAPTTAPPPPPYVAAPARRRRRLALSPSVLRLIRHRHCRRLAASPPRPLVRSQQVHGVQLCGGRQAALHAGLQEARRRPPQVLCSGGCVQRA